MIDNRRLAEILLPYGSVAKGGPSLGEPPFRRAGIWIIPFEEELVLQVPEAALPTAVRELLELLLVGMNAQEDRELLREQVLRWLAGTQTLDEFTITSLLEKMGWDAPARARIVVIEAVHGDPIVGELADAVEMLRELVTSKDCLLATDDQARIVLLLSDTESEETVFVEEVSGWLDTLGTELYSLFRAGVSTSIRTWASLSLARQEALFALEAGRLYLSKERVHSFGQLGLARLFHGLTPSVQDQFLQEVLPSTVFASLSLELRETVFAFLEHGLQVADTARSLYIHRNTLLYRLDRIAELTGYDVRKPLQAWTLWVALTLRRAR